MRPRTAASSWSRTLSTLPVTAKVWALRFDAYNFSDHRRWHLGKTVTDETEQQLLAQFCADLGQLRWLLRGPASATLRAVVEQAAWAARHGEPIGPWLARLLHDSGGSGGSPADSDVTRDVLPPRLPDVDTPPVTGIYRCPRDVCSRVEVRRAGSELSSCDIHEQALRFVADSGGSS
jgi:hypothetical protein